MRHEIRGIWHAAVNFSREAQPNTWKASAEDIEKRQWLATTTDNLMNKICLVVFHFHAHFSLKTELKSLYDGIVRHHGFPNYFCPLPPRYTRWQPKMFGSTFKLVQRQRQPSLNVRRDPMIGGWNDFNESIMITWRLSDLDRLRCRVSPRQPTNPLMQESSAPRCLVV